MGGDLAKQSFLLNTQIGSLNIQVISKTPFTKKQTLQADKKEKNC